MPEKKRKRSPKLKENISKIILFVFDIATVFMSLFLATFIILDTSVVNTLNNNIVRHTVGFLPLYVIISSVLLYNGIYTQRFDFWEETRKIIKGLGLSFLMVFTYSSITNTAEYYPNSLIILAFVFMTILIPIVKRTVKLRLFDLGYWKKGVKVLSENTYLSDEILGNPYLGYIKSKRKKTKVVFIDSYNKDPKELRKQLAKQIQTRNKVLFIPVFNNYQFSHRDIYQLTENRTNLVVLQNKLKSKYRMAINTTYNYILALVMLPLLLPIIGIIALAIKRDSKGPVFFRQKRLGRDGKLFMVYKFRTMHTEDKQKELLDYYLEENPQEVENYEIYCKYENDPRVTSVGKKLRSTSLDELAQIFNVLKGEMNFIGPRPYLETEKEKMGKYNEDVILKTKPGITGLWQVSGRNELTFNERMDLDRWYIQNWSLWRDFVIFMQTINVVLNKVGAR